MPKRLRVKAFVSKSASHEAPAKSDQFSSSFHARMRMPCSASNLDWRKLLLRKNYDVLSSRPSPKCPRSPVSPPRKIVLVNLAQLESDYYERRPDVDDPNQLVIFGTSGHRGSSLRGTFTEAHILAITQAICEYRKAQGIDGPLFMGKDTHALSGPAQRTALEVLAANEVETLIQRDDGFTPTPAVSLRHPYLQPRPLGSSCRRHCHYAIAQSSGGWWLQVQPSEWRSGGYRCHQVD